MARYCRYCGSRNADDAIFCEACGRNIGGAPTGAAQAQNGPRSTSQRVGGSGYGQYAPPRSGYPGEPAPGYPGPAPKKSGGKVFLIVLAVIAAVVVLGLAAYKYVLPRIAEKDGDSSLSGTVQATPAPEGGSRLAGILEQAAKAVGAAEDAAAQESPAKPVFSRKPEDTPEPGRTPEPERTPKPERPPEPETEVRSGYDPDDYTTTDSPTLGDFQWATYDLLQGWRPADADPLTLLDEVAGGWKGYFCGAVNGYSIEYLLNACLGGTEEDASVIIDWIYVFDGSVGEGFDDTTPDTTFGGSWSGGRLDALGPGRLELTEFWYSGGYEYGIGTFMWPDGETAEVFLVRP